MDTTQVQVTYGPGKIRKFNIPETPCTYEELKSDIQCRIPSLVGKMFGIQYLDDEENWIIAVSDTCISEAFRCSREIEGTYMRRMKLRIFDGCSPQVSGFSTDKRDVMEPKCLFESSRDPVEAIESDCKRQLRKSVYRSPLQLLIDELEDEVHVKSVEFESAKEHLKSLEKKFTNPNIKIDKTKSQCGQCHMRLGHTKRNCELGVCEGPQMCNDLDKHDGEKKQFCDASTTVKNITKDLEKVKQNLHLKKQTYENTCDTFFSRVLPHLVNTNTDKYNPVGSFGLRQLSMGAIHPDIAILDKHYRGIIPKDLDSAARCFGQILEKYQKDNRGPTEKPKNPIQRFMEERGVEFPKFKTPQTTTTTTSSTVTSASAPPVQYMPTYGYYPMGPMPMPYQFNASPLMMNQRRMPVGSPLPMTVCNPTQSPSFGCNEMDTVGPDAFDDESEYIACLPPKKRKL